MSSDPHGHISQQAITHLAVSSSTSDKTTTDSRRPPSESGHAVTSSFAVGSPPTPPLPQAAHSLLQPTASPHSVSSAQRAPSSSPHPGNVQSAVQSEPTHASGVTTSFNQPVPSPPVSQITTVSLPMAAPSRGPHTGDEQRPDQFTSSSHPISPSSAAHTPGSIDATTAGAYTFSVPSTTSIPALGHQPHTLATTVPAATSASASVAPGPVTATPILPSTSPNAPIVAPTQAQSHFYDSGPGPAASAVAGPSRKLTQESIQESEKEYEDDAEQSHGNVPPQAHGYEHTSAPPVAGPSGQTNVVAQMQPQRTTVTPPQELPSSGAAPIARGSTTGTHTNVGDGGPGNGAGIGAGYASGSSATQGYNSSALALGNRHGQRAQNSSPGRRTSTRTVSYTEPPLPSRAADRYPIHMPATNPSQPVAAAGVSKSLPMPPLAHHANASGSGDLVLSPQPDAGAMLRSELDWAVPYTPGSHAAAHGNGSGSGNSTGMGMLGMPGGVGATGVQTGSRHESRRGSAYVGNGNGSGGAHRRSMSMAATLVQGGGEKMVAERLEPTLEAAERELRSARRMAQIQGWALNAAIGAQVVFGALTTGVAAATTGKQTSIATSILGGLSTLAASYLAKARGSGEPERSAKRARELESFIRDLQAFMLDHGHLTSSAAGGTQAEQHEAMVARYRRRFEEIMGNALEGVEDTMKAEKQMAEMKSASMAGMREKSMGKVDNMV